MFSRLRVRACWVAAFLASLSAPLRGAENDALYIARYKQMLAADPAPGTALDRLWKIYQDEGRTAQLLEEYKAAPDSFPNSLLLGYLSQKAGMRDAALAAFRHAALLDPASPLPHTALGDALADAGSAREAAIEFEQAAARLKDSDSALPDVLQKAGTAWKNAGEPAKAAAAWERMTAIDPANLDLHERLAETYEKNSLPEKAIVHLQYIESHADAYRQTVALQELARLYQTTGQPEAAMAALQKALAMTSPENWMRVQLEDRLIALAQRSGKSSDLEKRWKAEAARNPRDIASYLPLIELYERLPDPAQAKTWLEKLVSLAPKETAYKARLVRVLLQLNETDKAAAMLDEILQARPGDQEALFARADIDVQRNQPDQAIARIEALLQSTRGDEALESRALAFYSGHRLYSQVEKHLVDASKKAGDENSISALATFYFSQRRPAEGKKTLETLVERAHSPAERAAAYSKIAAVLKEQNDMAGAGEALRKIVALAPDSSENHLAYGEFLLGAGDPDGGQREIEAAYAAAKTDKEREEADAKLFEAFQTVAQKEEGGDSGAESPGLPGLITLPGGAFRVPPAGRLVRFANQVEVDVAKTPTAAGYLRLARWESWAGRPKEALLAAQEALDLSPLSLEARRLLVKLSISQDQKPGAIAHLQELETLDPPNAAAYSKQIGQLQLETGHANEALETFSQRVKSHPGDADALADLAFAQEQADLWQDALATWEKAWSQVSPPRRKEIVEPLLRVYEKLGLYQKGADLLLGAVIAESEQQPQSTLLQDLIAYCQKYRLLDWLRDRFEQRHAALPEDWFTADALAKIVTRQGDVRKAIAVMSESSWFAPDQPQALREIVEAAKAAGDLDQALASQNRLVLLAAQEDPAPLQELAALQELTLDYLGAGESWDRLALRFSRDPAVVGGAAAFFEKWGEPEKAIRLLERVRESDPTNIEILSALAKLDSRAGKNAEAIAAWQQILDQSVPEKAGGPMRFPGLSPTDLGKLQQAYFAALRWHNGRPDSDTMRMLQAFRMDTSAHPTGEEETRLAAIQAISGLLKTGPEKEALKRWIDRWRTAGAQQPMEALWAFYYSGAAEPAMHLLSAMMKAAPENPELRNAFIWLSLRMGEYAKLSEWIADPHRTAGDKDLLLIALADESLTQGGRLDPKLLPALFPENFRPRELIWQAAVEFASQNRYAEAVPLGEKVLARQPAGNINVALDLAHWHIYLGQVDAARSILGKVIWQGEDAFDAPVYDALREYYYLLPAAERDPFVESYSRAMKEPILHRAVGLSLLYGLQDDKESARGQLAQLLSLHALSLHSLDDYSSPVDYRHWEYLLTAGLQLESWKLDWMAADLWELARPDLPLVRSLQGDQAVELARDLLLRIFANKLARATPPEFEAMLDDYIRSHSPETALLLPSVLENRGDFAQCAKVYQYLWDRDPGNPQYIRDILNVCRIDNDLGTAKAALTKFIEDPRHAANKAVLQDCLGQLTEILEGEGAWDQAQALLEKTLASSPENRQAMEMLAKLQERSGRFDAAADLRKQLLARDPTNSTARVALANALDAAGKTAEAISTLEEGKTAGHPSDYELRLAQLYAKAGRLQDVLNLSDALFHPGNEWQVESIAAPLAGAGQKQAALRLLARALDGARDERHLFQLQRALVWLLSPEEEKPLFDKELKRLRDLTLDKGYLLSAYIDFRCMLAEKYKWDPVPVLLEEWQGGAGSLAAGMKLVETEIPHDLPKAAETLRLLLDRPQMDEWTLQWLDERLKTLGQQAMALDVSETLCSRNPANENYIIDHARLLAGLGRKSEAVTLLQNLAARFVINEEMAGRVGRILLELGAPSAAEPLLDIAVRLDPDVHDYETYLADAEVLAGEKRFPQAREVLQAAFTNPKNRSVNRIVDLYDAWNRLDRVDGDAAQFDLSPELRTDLRLSLFAHEQKAGKSNEAIDLVALYPELTGSATASGLRKMAAGTNRFDAVSHLLEKALSQSASPDAETTRQTALLYADWAHQDLAAFHTEPALQHLARANELAPAEYDVAKDLSRLYLEKKDSARAAQVLNKFIATSHDQAQRDQARQLLASYHL